ncbi:hypothetical protein Taro_027716 [Colocasia esculenta]|uniref:Uncharacterized protein n=1 Tax=Colocasia esculenta TaxID=4460 RepID=A0A843VFA5_COLES|nr:hypothetical protein [Colocasia esculenta]
MTSEAHPYPHRNLKWQIEEIGVVEEMIQREHSAYDREDLGETHRYSEEDGLAGTNTTGCRAIWGWRDYTFSSSSATARSGDAFCITCATTTASLSSRGAGDADGEVSEIAAAYLLRRAKSRYSGTLGP